MVYRTIIDKWKREKVRKEIYEETSALVHELIILYLSVASDTRNLFDHPIDEIR